MALGIWAITGGITTLAVTIAVVKRVTVDGMLVVGSVGRTELLGEEDGADD